MAPDLEPALFFEGFPLISVLEKNRKKTRGREEVHVSEKKERDKTLYCACHILGPLYLLN